MGDGFEHLMSSVHGPAEKDGTQSKNDGSRRVVFRGETCKTDWVGLY